MGLNFNIVLQFEGGIKGGFYFSGNSRTVDFPIVTFVHYPPLILAKLTIQPESRIYKKKEFGKFWTHSEKNVPVQKFQLFGTIEISELLLVLKDTHQKFIIQ